MTENSCIYEKSVNPSAGAKLTIDFPSIAIGVISDRQAHLNVASVRRKGSL